MTSDGDIGRQLAILKGRLAALDREPTARGALSPPRQAYSEPRRVEKGFASFSETSVSLQLVTPSEVSGHTARLAVYDNRAYLAHMVDGEADMAVAGVVPKAKQTARSRVQGGPVRAAGSAPLLASVLEEARLAGLFEGEKTEHVSFRAPPALVEAAKREAGVSSTSELGVLALAMLARPDPVAAFFRRTAGRLGADHDLEY